jgi:hypothetical protein
MEGVPSRDLDLPEILQDRSRSLFSLASPRATDPNTRKLWAPRCFSAAPIGHCLELESVPQRSKRIKLNIWLCVFEFGTQAGLLSHIGLCPMCHPDQLFPEVWIIVGPIPCPGALQACTIRHRNVSHKAVSNI